MDLRPRIFEILLAALSASVVIGCGRYGRPLTPEMYAPKAVNNLQVKATLEGNSFKWEAPERDARGKELVSLDGYKVYRKQIIKRSDIIDERVEYQLLKTITDSHVELLQKLREDARKAGQISRKLKVDSALKRFEYSDTTVQPGLVYLYKIVPVNQGDVEGEPGKLVRIVVRGDSSEISFIDQLKAEDGLGQDERLETNSLQFGQ